MAQLFGNKPFFEFIKQYGIEKMPIKKRYKTKAVKYYRNKINSDVTGQISSGFNPQDVPTKVEGVLTSSKSSSKKDKKQKNQFKGFF